MFILRADLRTDPLTILTLLCRSAVGFPFWLLILSLRTGDQTVQAACCGILAAGAFAVMLWRRFAVRRFSAKQAFCLTGVLLLLTMALSVFLLLRLVPGSYIIVGTLPVFTLPAMLYGSDRPVSALFTGSHLTAFIIGVLFDTLLQSLTTLPFPMPLICAVTAAVCVLWLLLRNQLMLNRLVQRRGDTAGEVPADIRKSNLRMVVFTVLLLAFTLLFRRNIYRLFTMTGDALALLVRKLLHGLLALIRWLSGDGAEEAGEILQQEEEEVVPQDGSALWSLLLLVFVPVVVVIWKNLISDWIFDLREAWRRFCSRLAAKRRAGRPAAEKDNEEFTDTESDARPVRAERRQRRSWNRSLRAWQRQPDSDAKFYAGYALMLEAPAWENGQPRPSETAAEIRQRWQESHADTFGRVTEDLHADRYAETGLPQGAVSDAAEALAALRREKRK